jgi:hypothetical protein
VRQWGVNLVRFRIDERRLGGTFRMTLHWRVRACFASPSSTGLRSVSSSSAGALRASSSQPVQLCCWRSNPQESVHRWSSVRVRRIHTAAFKALSRNSVVLNVARSPVDAGLVPDQGLLPLRKVALLAIATVAWLVRFHYMHVNCVACLS